MEGALTYALRQGAREARQHTVTGTLLVNICVHSLILMSQTRSPNSSSFSLEQLHVKRKQNFTKEMFPHYIIKIVEILNRAC